MCWSEKLSLDLQLWGQANKLPPVCHITQQTSCLTSDAPCNLFIVCLFWDRVLNRSPGWLWIYEPPAASSWVLRLQSCATTASSMWFLKRFTIVYFLSSYNICCHTFCTMLWDPTVSCTRSTQKCYLLGGMAHLSNQEAKAGGSAGVWCQPVLCREFLGAQCNPISKSKEFKILKQKERYFWFGWTISNRNKTYDHILVLSQQNATSPYY